MKLLYKLGDNWGSIPRKNTQNRFKMIATLTSLKLEPKLLSSGVKQRYEAFHLAQNLGRKLEDVRGRGLGNLIKMVFKKPFFPLFSTFITLLHKL